MTRTLTAIGVLIALLLQIAVVKAADQTGATAATPQIVASLSGQLSLSPKALGKALDGNMSVVEPVQYSCKRDCRRCRRRCTVRWKYDCYEYDCRRRFSNCMKYCWEDICRDCY